MKTTWFAVVIGSALGLVGGGVAIVISTVLQELAPSVPKYGLVGGVLALVVAVAFVFYGRRRWPAVLNFDADIAELFGAARTPRVSRPAPVGVTLMLASAMVVGLIAAVTLEGAVAGALTVGAGVLIRLIATLYVALADSGSRDIAPR
jgi:predicted membrane protein